jgi:hypothetical protein
MRTYSTPESALKQEITKLAIIETVVAVTLYVGIAMYFGTFKYLAMAVVVAPLMLFRTEASADWGFKVYSKFGEGSLRLENRLPFAFYFFLCVIVAPVVGIAIRIGGTVYWAIRRPLQTLKGMPQNWLRQSFCTDFLHPPEILPLEAAKGDQESVPTFVKIWNAIREEHGGMAVLAFLVSLPFLVIGYLPSMIYRVSFKATAIAYAPFVWVAHATLRNPLSVKARLERITKGELEKVRRAFSWIIVATLLAKIGLVVGWVDRNWIEARFPGQGFIQNFVVLDGLPWWQITLGADALLTFVLFFFADAALARLDTEKVWREETTLKTLSTASFLRAVLSIATMSHFFFIALIAIAPGSLRRLLVA